LQLVGVLGILSAVLIRELSYARSVFDVHGSMEGADELVFPEDPFVLRRQGVRMKGTAIGAASVGVGRVGEPSVRDALWFIPTRRREERARPRRR
jgi:hypothetical protein